MPLPKPPAKRASLLTQTDFDSQAAPKPGKRSNKTSSSAEPASGGELHLYDSHAEAAAPPVLPPEAAPTVQHHHVKRPAVEPRLRPVVIALRDRQQPPRRGVRRPSRVPASRAAKARRSCSCSTPTC